MWISICLVCFVATLFVIALLCVNQFGQNKQNEPCDECTRLREELAAWHKAFGTRDVNTAAECRARAAHYSGRAAVLYERLKNILGVVFANPCFDIERETNCVATTLSLLRGPVNVELIAALLPECGPNQRAYAAEAIERFRRYVLAGTEANDTELVRECDERNGRE